MQKNLKVLIADDSTGFGENCARILKSYGMEVSLCEKDGIKVLDNIKKNKTDVIIADVFMPNLDVLGILNAIKEIDKNNYLYNN